MVATAFSLIALMIIGAFLVIKEIIEVAKNNFKKSKKLGIITLLTIMTCVILIAMLYI
ncbi:MAG: hypothetical protein MJZ20_07005 [Bacteroidaceae bacterium]|nr:hypothetical protein [Bacteroidaceae bacterium]